MFPVFLRCAAAPALSRNVAESNGRFVERSLSLMGRVLPDASVLHRGRSPQLHRTDRGHFWSFAGAFQIVDNSTNRYQYEGL